MVLTLKQIEDRLEGLEEGNRNLERRLLSGRNIEPVAGASLPRSPLAPFDSGLYTPTLTNGTNVAASTTFEAQWIRIDDVVNVSGVVSVDPTNATADTRLGVSLPFTSNIGSQEDVSGVCGQHVVSALSAGSVRGDTSNNRAELLMHPSGSGNSAWSFIFQYQILG